jgi:hypothetical protein
LISARTFADRMLWNQTLSDGQFNPAWQPFFLAISTKKNLGLVYACAVNGRCKQNKARSGVQKRARSVQYVRAMFCDMLRRNSADLSILRPNSNRRFALFVSDQ